MKQETTNELVIQLPTTRVKDVPQTRSFRWIKALHEALKPLSEYRLQDGGSALVLTFAAGNGVVARGNRPFEETFAWDRKESDLWTSTQLSDFVCEIKLYSARGVLVMALLLRFEEFLGDAAIARNRFADVIAHLEEHAVPQVAPEYITNALAALEGKGV